LSHSIHFDRALVSLVAWGESHGLLPEALRISKEVFEDRIEQQASLIRRLLPPVTMVAVGMLVFCVIIGLMMPLVKLIEALSR
jgi:type II secretory pathway component PulF